eukprot:493859-Pyramimonas_sp.AAC.1
MAGGLDCGMSRCISFAHIGDRSMIQRCPVGCAIGPLAREPSMSPEMLASKAESFGDAALPK